MEREENEHRMDLTPSEKVEIAKRIEEAMDGRQGSNQHKQKVGVQNFVQAESGTKTIEIAAKAVDMNRETYRQAKAVVDSGNIEVISWSLSVSTNVATLLQVISTNHVEKAVIWLT